MVGVSQSGGSPDLVQSLEVARQQGALTLAITNQPGSPLARAAELEIDVMAGKERAVAATKSYTAQLLALYLIIDRLRGGDGSVSRCPARPRRAGDHERRRTSASWPSATGSRPGWSPRPAATRTRPPARPPSS